MFQPHVEGTDDRQDWAEVLEAMGAMGMSSEEQFGVISTTAAVLHLGNINFREAGVEKAVPEEADCMVTWAEGNIFTFMIFQPWTSPPTCCRSTRRS